MKVLSYLFLLRASTIYINLVGNVDLVLLFCLCFWWGRRANINYTRICCAYSIPVNARCCSQRRPRKVWDSSRAFHTQTHQFPTTVGELGGGAWLVSASKLFVCHGSWQRINIVIVRREEWYDCLACEVRSVYVCTVLIVYMIKEVRGAV